MSDEIEVTGAAAPEAEARGPGRGRGGPGGDRRGGPGGDRRGGPGGNRRDGDRNKRGRDNSGEPAGEELIEKFGRVDVTTSLANWDFQKLATKYEQDRSL